MAISHTATRNYQRTTQTPIIQKIEKVTSDKECNLDVAAPIAANTQYKFVVTVADLKSIVLSSDQNVDLYTNDTSGGSPQEHIPLVAGVPLQWTLLQDGAGKIPFAGNLTSIYVTNGSAHAANIKVRGIVSAA